MSQPPAVPPVAVGPLFKLVLRWVGCLTVLALGVALAVALVRTYAPPENTQALDRIFDGFFGLGELGFGAIVGLVGGKNL